MLVHWIVNWLLGALALWLVAQIIPGIQINSFKTALLATVVIALVDITIGPILFQLPPAMKCDVALLRSYLDLLPADLRYAFEFRHASWLVEEVYDALRQRNVSLCVAESERLEVPQVITADFVYYRLRKPEYTPEDVDAIVARSKEVLATGRDLYLMFKHEESPEGALNAETVLKSSR